MDKVEVYGADWCEDTNQARKLLDSLNVSYQYINIEQESEAARWVKQQNDGKREKTDHQDRREGACGPRRPGTRRRASRKRYNLLETGRHLAALKLLCHRAK